MLDAAEIDVAPNLLNTLNPAVRLPLVKDQSSALQFQGNFGVFRTYVPSRFGGVLEVGCNSTGAQVVVAYQGNPVVDAAGKAVPKGATVKATIPSGQFGWFDIAVSGVSGTYSMWALFSEIGIARDGSSDSADPLIPWNFWYFPFAKSRADFTAWGSSKLQPCTKYETAFGKSNVLQWEKDNHNDPDGTQLGWVGHCHNSAPASILFKPPDPAGKTVGSTNFSCEELKFFAAEFYGQKGVDNSPWGLPGTGPMGRQGFFQENKPEDNPKRFGTLIAGLHNALRTTLHDNRQAGFMDMRDVSGSDPAAVWNQAIYKYVAQMWETTPVGDWHDIQVQNTLFGNEDVMPADFSSSGSPAKIVANGPGAGGTPKDAEWDPTAISRNGLLNYRVIFKPDGDINATHANNEWQSAQTGDGKTGLYGPRFLFVPSKPGVNPGPDGNTNIDPGDTTSLLELRDSFK